MTSPADPHAGQPVVSAGAPLGAATAVVILVHGRNARPAQHPGSRAATRPTRHHLPRARPRRTGRGIRTVVPGADATRTSRSSRRRCDGSTRWSPSVVVAGVPRERDRAARFLAGRVPRLGVRCATRPRATAGSSLSAAALIGPPGTTWDHTASLAGDAGLLRLQRRRRACAEGARRRERRGLHAHGRRRHSAHLSRHGTPGERRRDRSRAGGSSPPQRAQRRARSDSRALPSGTAVTAVREAPDRRALGLRQDAGDDGQRQRRQRELQPQFGPPRAKSSPSPASATAAASSRG